MTRKSYIVLNIIFIVIISGIFIYCYFINSLDENISCIHNKYLGIDCPSCGLTRSFSALLHHDSKTAIVWNKYGFQIFLFFIIQIGLRVFFLLLVSLKNINLKILTKTDMIISSVLFLVCFSPFIFSTFYLFYKMLMTGNVSI